MRKLLQKIVHPIPHVIIYQPFLHHGYLMPLFSRIHGHRLVNGIGYLYLVHRIDQQRFARLACRRCELTKHQYALLSRAARYVFLRNQVHPIAEWSDQSHVCRLIQRTQFIESEVAVAGDHGLPLQGRVRSVDTANVLLDHFAPFVVLGDDDSRGNNNEYEYDLLAPLGIFVQEFFETPQPVCYPFGIVETIDRENDLASREVPLNFLPDLNGGRLMDGLVKKVIVDAQGEQVNFNGPVPQCNPTKLMVMPHHHAHRLKKMLYVFVRMKSDEIRAQQTSDEFLLPLTVKQPENLVRRERYMQEESDCRVRQLFTYELGKEEKMIVVNPEYVARPKY